MHSNDSKYPQDQRVQAERSAFPPNSLKNLFASPAKRLDELKDFGMTPNDNAL